ncbi:hypothetical protein PanWU01x14_161300 [Parasponia andersonii]|uniref:Uncharacterized protein n=1 Tax=Parasponia andersonii TaxID=3476 RepID=A0A2P5CDQ8_PARAD|nr:hypothetical protein PanWU01x14_161300 [Parasponia andersonii]
MALLCSTSPWCFQQIPTSVIPSSSSRKQLRFSIKSPFGCGGGDDHDDHHHHLSINNGLTKWAASTSTATHPPAFKCFSQNPSQSESQLEFERLFSNLNQATLKREPGSLTSAIFLVAGTTVVTGLLIAEVNVNTMCELGSGGVSLVSMALRTLGKAGVQIAW